MRFPQKAQVEEAVSMCIPAEPINPKSISINLCVIVNTFNIFRQPLPARLTVGDAMRSEGDGDGKWRENYSKCLRAAQGMGKGGEKRGGPEFVSIYFTLELMRCCRLTFCKCSGCSNRILVAEA